MHPLTAPVLAIVGGLATFGIVLLAAIGLVRRPDPSKYREIWLKFGLHIGMMALGLLAGALGKWALLPLLLFLAFRGWQELLRAIAHKFGAIAMPRFLSLLGAIAMAGGLLPGSLPVFIAVAAATWIGLALPMLLTRRPLPLHGTLAMAFGMLFISLPLGFFLALGKDYGSFAFLFLLLMANDGLSEGLGRLFGKTPLWPAISPNKTWGGTLGGLASCLLIGYLVRFMVPGWPVSRVVVVAGGISLMAGVGDLIASSLKRELGIKDFGRILPGHGGVLDRFDSLLFTAPIFYAVVWYLA